jgi:NAD(P)-dependent dehydrogenase (short-subunit alcohol dehydrogenase family)
MEIQGKVALVTGGASGLGKATVLELAGAGARVVIVDLDEDKGKGLSEELGDASIFAKANVSQEEDIKLAVEQTEEAFGGLHIVINCAGIGGSIRVVGKDGSIYPLDHFKRIVEVNLVGTFNATRLSAPLMMKNDPDPGGERGVFINTSSVASFEGQIGQVAYAASKGGINSMTLVLAREFAQHGIRVLTIAPGIFDTPLLGKLPEKVKASLGRQVPFPPRLGRPEEYAGLARHIVENPALNGEVIRLDGAIRMAPR